MDNEEFYPSGRKKRPSLVCKVCQRRKGRQRNNTVCNPCLLLVTAENTFDKYGIPRESVAMQRMRQRANTYIRLLKAGKTQREAAEEMGYNVRGLRALMTKARQKGIDVPKISNVTLDFRPKKTGSAPGSNQHGGGRFGVTGCLCGPCATVRRKSRKENEELRQARRAQQQ